MRKNSNNLIQRHCASGHPQKRTTIPWRQISVQRPLQYDIWMLQCFSPARLGPSTQEKNNRNVKTWQIVRTWVCIWSCMPTILAPSIVC